MNSIEPSDTARFEPPPIRIPQHATSATDTRLRVQPSFEAIDFASIGRDSIEFQAVQRPHNADGTTGAEAPSLGAGIAPVVQPDRPCPLPARVVSLEKGAAVLPDMFRLRPPTRAATAAIDTEWRIPPAPDNRGAANRLAEKIKALRPMADMEVAEGEDEEDEEEEDLRRAESARSRAMDLEGITAYSPMFPPPLDPDPEENFALQQEVAGAPVYRHKIDSWAEPEYRPLPIACSIFGDRLEQAGDFYPVFTQITRRLPTAPARAEPRKAVTVVGDHYGSEKPGKLPLLWNLCSYVALAKNYTETGMDSSVFTYRQSFIRYVHAVALHVGDGKTGLLQLRAAVNTGVLLGDIPPYTWWAEDPSSGWGYVIVHLPPRTVVNDAYLLPWLMACYKNHLPNVPLGDFVGVTTPLPAPSADIPYYFAADFRASFDDLRRWFLANRRAGDPSPSSWTKKLPLTGEQRAEEYRLEQEREPFIKRRKAGGRRKPTKTPWDTSIRWIPRRLLEIEDFFSVYGETKHIPEEVLLDCAKLAKRYEYKRALHAGTSTPPKAAFVAALNRTAGLNEKLPRHKRIEQGRLEELVREADPTTTTCLAGANLVRLLGITDDISIARGYRTLVSGKLRAVQHIEELEADLEARKLKAKEREAKRSAAASAKTSTIKAVSGKRVQQLGRDEGVIRMLRDHQPTKEISDTLAVDGKQVRRIKEKLEAQGEVVTQRKLQRGRKALN